MAYKYFSLDEFKCQETSENKIDPHFVECLDHLRDVCGFSFIITSGYRSPNHSLEKNKPNGPGMHAQGLAADIKVRNGDERFTLVKNAIDMGFKGIGVEKDFVHVDLRDTDPVLWTY